MFRLWCRLLRRVARHSTSRRPIHARTVAESAVAHNVASCLEQAEIHNIDDAAVVWCQRQFRAAPSVKALRPFAYGELGAGIWKRQ